MRRVGILLAAVMTIAALGSCRSELYCAGSIAQDNALCGSSVADCQSKVMRFAETFGVGPGAEAKSKSDIVCTKTPAAYCFGLVGADMEGLYFCTYTEDGCNQMRSLFETSHPVRSSASCHKRR